MSNSRDYWTALCCLDLIMIDWSRAGDGYLIRVALPWIWRSWVRFHGVWKVLEFAGTKLRFLKNINPCFGEDEAGRVCLQLLWINSVVNSQVHSLLDSVN